MRLQQACSKLSISCNSVVILSSCYKVASHNTCWQTVELQLTITSCWNNYCTVTSLLSSTTLHVASCQQAVENWSTSWEQAAGTYPVDMLLEHHCYKSAAGLLQPVQSNLWQDYFNNRIRFLHRKKGNSLEIKQDGYVVLLQSHYLLSHFKPLKPFLQRHSYLVLWSTQVALFRQGFE
jgi:hypothetical protein